MSEETAYVRRRRGRLWSLSTTPEARNGAAILRLEGRLSHRTAHGLDREARRAIESPGVVELVLDLSDVDYLNSAALAVIETLSRDLAARGGRLTLRAPSAAARLALEIAGIL